MAVPQIYTVAEVVKDQMIEQGRTTLHKFEQLLPLAVRGLRELNINVGNAPKTVYLTPTPWNTIQAPDDMYSWSKIGVELGGFIYNLGMAPDMAFPHLRNPQGVLQPEPFKPYYGNFTSYLANAGLDVGWVYWAYTSYNEFGEFTGRLYGQGTGFAQPGFFNYNELTREFVLSPDLQKASIVLEYTSTGVNNASMPVPQVAIEPLIAFVNWKSSKGAERQQMMNEYHNAVMHYKVNKYSFGMTDFLNAIRQGYRLSPKG